MNKLKCTPNASSKPYATRMQSAAFAALALCSVLLFGCGAAQSPSPEAEESAEFTTPAWPPPPDEARIKFVTAYHDDESLGAASSFGDTLDSFLTGRRRRTERLRQPMDIAISPDGKRVYVTDFAVRSVFLLDFEAKSLTRVGGEEKTWAYPFGVALDAEENLYVTEQEDRAITVVGRDGKVKRQFSDPSLERPTDIEIDIDKGLIYVADGSHQASSNHYIKVFDMEGKFLRNIGKGKGSADGYLMFPTYMALGPDGSLYVTDTVNARVSVFDSEGNFERRIGERGNAFGMFDKPKGVALDSFGNIYVVDSGWSNVQIFNPDGQILLFFGGRGAFPGMLRNPTGIAINADDTIYVGDYLNHRLDVYQLVNTEAGDSYLETTPVQ